MKHKPTSKVVATVMFGAVTLLFFVFFIYMSLCENVSVYQARPFHTMHTVQDYTVETVYDETAPAGVRTVYRWTLESDSHTENCIGFYLVHQYADVYYDDEMMYSLTAAAGNRIGGTISSNWVTVPVYLDDNGKQVTIVLTPLFENMIDFEPEFLVGSHFSIVFSQLKRDFAQPFLSMLCIVLGLLIIAVYLYFMARSHSRPWDMICLGSFSVLLGVWRIADTKSSPLLFAGNPMVLGYITIGALFLCSIPLLMYVSTLFTEGKGRSLVIVSVAGSSVCLVTLLLQVLGVAEFRELLVLSHVMLIFTTCMVPLLRIAERHQRITGVAAKGWKYFLLLGAGVFLDLIFFYITDSSSDVTFTMLGFLLYAIVIFITNTLETTRKAYTDERTGLVNKFRWNELMNDANTLHTVIGVMMLDLNAMKHVNDTMGHEAGDLLIFNFSNILRNTLPSSSVICRWGGDEFTVMIAGASGEQLRANLRAIRTAVDEYNATHGEPYIFYAGGCASSQDHPSLSCRELLAIADGNMYADKQAWYAGKTTNN